MQLRKFTLDVDKGNEGIWYITSKDIRGLLVADDNLEEGLARVPATIDSLERARELNTCMPSSLKRRSERALAGIERHLANHPHDDASKQRASVLRKVIGV